MNSSHTGREIYNTFLPVHKGVWKQDKKLSYDFLIEDTSKVFDIGFELEHTNNYPYKNIYLFVTVINHMGHSFVDTLNIDLQSEQGAWKGNSIVGGFRFGFYYIKAAKFREKGLYQLEVRQAMRDTMGISGINKLGVIVIEKNNEQK